MAGAQRNAFPCVVAGGADSLVVHYLRYDKGSACDLLHTCAIFSLALHVTGIGHVCHDGLCLSGMHGSALQHAIHALQAPYTPS